MAHQVLMPKQGNTVESCIIVEWNVKVGDTVDVGTVLCSAETDKSTIDVESTVAGTVLALLYNEGDDVPVMIPIAVVGEAGEQVDVPVAQAAAPTPVEEPSAPPVFEAPAPAAAPTGGEALLSSPRARASALERGIPLSTISATGPKGRIIERDVLASGGQPLSPAAREAALQGQLSAPVSGSGIGEGPARLGCSCAAHRWLQMYATRYPAEGNPQDYRRADDGLHLHHLSVHMSAC